MRIAKEKISYVFNKNENYSGFRYINMINLSLSI